MWFMPRSSPRRNAAIAEARSPRSRYQVPCPMTATSCFVEPSRRRSIIKSSIGHDGVGPAAGWGERFGLCRTPCPWVVFVQRRAGLEHRVNDAPGFLDVILSGEQGGIARHRISEHALVGVHLSGAGMAAGQQFSEQVLRIFD